MSLDVLKKHPANRRILAYLEGMSAHSDVVEVVQAIVASTNLGRRVYGQTGQDFPWAAWHVDGAIFAYACGEGEVGYLCETTDSDHPAGGHWETQNPRDPSENLEWNIKNALCLVCWD